MASFLDKLNLQPQERKLLLVGVVIVAVFLNYWLIWPYFSEWSKVQASLFKARQEIATYSAEIGKKNSYETRIQTLQKSAPGILPAAQANSVLEKIQSQGRKSGVSIGNATRRQHALVKGGQTNDFFDEVAWQVEIAAGEPELVDFLYSLGNSDSNIRVRDITSLRLDPAGQTRLVAKLELFANFQKKPPTPAASTNRTSSTNKPSPAKIQPKGPTPAPATNKAAKK